MRSVCRHKLKSEEAKLGLEVRSDEHYVNTITAVEIRRISPEEGNHNSLVCTVLHRPDRYSCKLSKRGSECALAALAPAEQWELARRLGLGKKCMAAPKRSKQGLQSAVKGALSSFSAPPMNEG